MSDMFDAETQGAGPVECLGKTFPSDSARRKHFLNLLAEKLKDPEFRKQEGFPKGTDEAILEMSDPPFYTACPNPWLQDFVEQYGKPYDPLVKYTREPLAIDVSVGKTDSLYKAHGYHTKVPHLAIVPSILHYTEPDDVVLDGFAGSGMTGVAAQWCGVATAEYRHKLEIEWKQQDKPAPQWGARRVVLNDLSPAAAFIAANYNLPFDVEIFAQVGRQLLQEAEEELGWMYETTHIDGISKGRIEYTVWSEVFNCSECAGEVNFLDAALDQESKRVREEFDCPHCGFQLNKKKLNKCYLNVFDPALNKTVQTAKRLPSLIFYNVGGTKYEKKPDSADLQVIRQVAAMESPLGFPADRMMNAPEDRESWGDKWRSGTASFTHVHHLFLPRARHALSLMWRKAQAIEDRRTRNMALYFIEQSIWGMSLLARYTPTHFSQVNQYLTGVYYIGSQVVECSPEYVLGGKLKRLGKAFQNFRSFTAASIITSGSATQISVPDKSIDYIFTDPPFGDNLAYSELNFIVESFHGVVTPQEPEAVMSNSQKKGLLEYHRLMRDCFSEYYRVLKPGRWMTVVFSNTKASVWNGIQTALQEAGFVIANVSALNKKQGSFNAVTNTTSVKQDLVITAYKPNGGLEDRFSRHGATIESVWDFVQTHLKQLPIVKMKSGQLEYIPERDPRILFDRMIAWFVRHNSPVPMSSLEFQNGLSERFDERDGMIFLSEQVAEYDKKRAQVPQAPQMEFFVSDERSAIDWLSDFLKNRPSTSQEIHPEFTAQMGAGWKKHEARPELKALLEDNFLEYTGNGQVPSQIHSYLSTNHKDLRSLDKGDPRLITKAKGRWYVPDPNKAHDLEKKRERALLREFQSYLEFSGRRLKEFRLEVLRAGFKDAYSKKDYQTIVSIAKKIPDESLQEDEKLLLWYDQALTRTEGGL